LYFIKYDAVKCIGNGVTAPYILNQNTSWRWVVSVILWLPHHGKNLGIQWLECWLSFRATLSAMKEKNFCLLAELISNFLFI